MTSAKHRDIRGKIKAIAIGTVALLTMTAAAAAPAGDEVFGQRSSVSVNGQPLTSFDMSFVDPTLGLYFLADRSNAAIDVLQTGTFTPPTATTLGAGVFVGIASGGNTSGPNGVITANKHTEVWAGDGPSIDSITGLSTSHVVVIDVASNVATHKIDTGGVMRAGKLCEDPKDRLVLVANDDPQDLFLSFISTNKYKVVGKIELNGSDPNGAFIKATNATNGIAQCQWSQFTGNFYVAVPEVGGPGNNSAAGAVLVVDPKNMNVEQVFPIDTSQCAATGFNNFPPTLTSKWLELLVEIVPRTARVMYLFNPPTAPFAQRFLEPLKGAASSIGVRVVASPVHDPAEIETVIAGFVREPDGGLIVLPGTFMLVHRDLIIGPAERYRLPAIYAFRYFAESGGLISYGSVPADAYRQAATYIDQILRGAKPADLPVQMSVKFELVVNLKTAKAMSLKIPESLLVRADKVIE